MQKDFKYKTKMAIASIAILLTALKIKKRKEFNKCIKFKVVKALNTLRRVNNCDFNAFNA